VTGKGPHRSVLFMPVTNTRAVEKAVGLPADTIILDLEDSIGAASKDEAAEQLTVALSRDFGYRTVLIRINGLQSDLWQQDIEAVRAAIAQGGRCHGIVLPKIETCEEIRQVENALDDNRALAIWIMIETPTAVQNAGALCGYGAPVAGVMVGTADLAKELKLPDPRFLTVPQESLTPPSLQVRAGLVMSLSLVVIAARAADIVVIDGVYMNFRDSEGLEREAWQGLSLGFEGKSLIHPAQLDVTNRVFSPSESELSEAREMIETWQASSDSGQAVCSFKGALVEELHVRQARARLELAQRIAERADKADKPG